MKPIIRKAPFFSALLLAAGITSHAQETPPKSSNYLEISYGPRTIFNLQSFSTMNNDQDQFDFNSFSNPGTFGLRYDHLLNSSFSLGIDFYYLQKRSSGTMTEYTTGIQQTAEYIINRFKTQIRVAYHFPISNPDLDVYIGGGVGMNNQTRKLLIGGAAASRSEYPSNLNFPVSLRTYAGLRYSFSKHFGVNAELGIGGPLINAGFHVRF